MLKTMKSDQIYFLREMLYILASHKYNLDINNKSMDQTEKHSKEHVMLSLSNPIHQNTHNKSFLLTDME